MLNIKYIKLNKNLILESNKKRNYFFDIKNLLKLDFLRKNIKLNIDKLKNIKKKKNFINYKNIKINQIN